MKTAYGLDETPQASNSLISLEAVRNRLGTIWIASGILITLLVIIQSLLGHYQQHSQQVWEWLLPNLIPTLGMIISVLASTALVENASGTFVRMSFYRLSATLSVFYLCLILMSILIQPFVNVKIEDQLVSLRGTSLWLGPFQGLVGSSLGVLFASKANQSASRPKRGHP